MTRVSPLDVEFESRDLNRAITIREYFKELLCTMWRKGEGFSGKRPFGNSGWDWDVYKALIQSGHLQGTLDEYGDIEDLDTDAAHEYVRHEIIEKLF